MQGTKHSETFYFSSPEHLERFKSVLEAIGKTWIDRYDHNAVKVQEEYACAVYVLTSSLGTWERASSYVSSGGIQFPELLEEVHWSGGYLNLLRWAANLFNERFANQNPIDISCSLDERNFQVAITALIIRRKSWPLQYILDHADIETEAR